MGKNQSVTLHVLHKTVLYSTVICSTVLYCTVYYCNVQYSTVILDCPDHIFYMKIEELLGGDYLDCFSWLAKANLAAFSCSLANLFSYLETFLRVGLMNLPFMSLTEMVSSLIWRSRRMTSRCRKNISPSRLYHLSKYCWQIFFRSSMEAESRSALVPHLSAITLSLSSAFLSCSFFSSSAAFFLSRVLSFFFLSGVMNPFFLAMVTESCYRFWMEMRASRSFRGTGSVR